MTKMSGARVRPRSYEDNRLSDRKWFIKKLLTRGWVSPEALSPGVKFFSLPRHFSAGFLATYDDSSKQITVTIDPGNQDSLMRDYGTSGYKPDIFDPLSHFGLRETDTLQVTPSLTCSVVFIRSRSAFVGAYTAHHDGKLPRTHQSYRHPETIDVGGTGGVSAPVAVSEGPGGTTGGEPSTMPFATAAAAADDRVGAGAGASAGDALAGPGAGIELVEL